MSWFSPRRQPVASAPLHTPVLVIVAQFRWRCVLARCSTSRGRLGKHRQMGMDRTSCVVVVVVGLCLAVGVASAGPPLSIVAPLVAQCHRAQWAPTATMAQRFYGFARVAQVCRSGYVVKSRVHMRRPRMRASDQNGWKWPRSPFPSLYRCLSRTRPRIAGRHCEICAPSRPRILASDGGPARDAISLYVSCIRGALHSLPWWRLHAMPA